MATTKKRREKAPKVSVWYLENLYTGLDIISKKSKSASSDWLTPTAGQWSDIKAFGTEMYCSFTSQHHLNEDMSN